MSLFESEFYFSPKPSDFALPYLLSQFELSADIHARQLGWGIDKLNAKGTSWVMTRIWGEFLRQPKLDEGLRLATFPSKVDRLLTYRDFILEDANEQLVGHVRTEWLIIDLTTRKAQRLPDDIHSLLFQPPQPEPLLVGWEEPTTWANEKKHVVTDADLDINQHMNNRRYISLLLENELGKMDFLPRFFDLKFKAEALNGDELIVRTQTIDHDFFGQLQNSVSGKLLVTFATTFSG